MTVKVYSKPGCTFCVKAKEWLQDKNIPYEYILLDPKDDDCMDKVDELVHSTKQTTFPFIFVGDTFLGGYTDLIGAYETLRLHELLKHCGVTIEYDF